MPFPARRSVLRAGLVTGAAALLPSVASPALAGPGLVRSGRPELTHGIATGDPTSSGAVVWARSSRTARMMVTLSRTPDFRRSVTVRGPVVTDASDYTGQVDVRFLPSGSRVYYRVRLEDPDRHGVHGDSESGSFVTAPLRRRDIRFLWSGDMVGQGWGSNPDLGEIPIFSRMLSRQPDFFLNSGDTIYADGPLLPSVTLPDGRVWRNVVTSAKSKVAETLSEYRGQWAYNLLDPGVRRFYSSVPQIVQWDDHEVTNNWYPGEVLSDPRYVEQRVDVLAARARRAFFEWMPIRRQRHDSLGRVYRKLSYGPLLDVFVVDMRTYKNANSPNLSNVPDGGVLGWEQQRWLVSSLLKSNARWKIVAADLPLGLVVPDGAAAQEGLAQGDPGAPLGRELQVASVLSALRRHDVRNVVWLTADVHYTAAHHYSPERAAFTDFLPFWEFVSGPLNAGAFGPNALDATFGPEAVFVHAPPAPNASPLEGFQHFGEVEISAETAELTVHLRDQDGTALYSKTLQPHRR